MSEDQSGEAGLIRIRREKADRLRQEGADPFANDVRGNERVTLGDLRQRFAEALLEPVSEGRYDAQKVLALAGSTTYRVFGRLMSRRGFGKAVFMELRDSSGQLQLFAKKDVLGDKFAVMESLDVGDHVEASGTVMATKTGELTLELAELRVVTKALRPLPEKWHGLTDVDLRYRRRYLDLIANREVQAVLAARSWVVQGVRDFLDRRGFLEVETPTLHLVVGGAAARPFNTHHNALDLDLFLRIAPELHLKRLLVGGFERVYEIGRAYRNEGLSTRHNPEFTILEFYQAYATYLTLMDMAEELFRHVDGFLRTRMEERGLASSYQGFKEQRGFTLEEPFARVPLKDALELAIERAGLPKGCLADLEAHARNVKEPEAYKRLLAELGMSSARAGRIELRNLGAALAKADNEGEKAFLAYEYLAEPFLSQDYRAKKEEKSVPVFIVDYPAEVSPLARRKDGDPTLVDRFELFVEGRELGNAFSELNDPDDQARRFREQVEKKKQGAEETMDYDEDYIVALEHGMPPAAGFGMGIDRLVMALCSQPSIRDVIAFPLLRPES